MRNEAQCRNLASATSLPAVVAALALAIMLMLGNSAVAQGKQLMAPGVGWASSGGALYWTTDNGKEWKNITPRIHGGIVSVFFLDSSTGWVLGSPLGEVPADFELAFTQDSGSSWSVTQLNLGVDPNSATLLGQGDIEFLDTDHGWMNLALQSGAPYHSGLLYRTEDGGKHWTLSKGPGTAGELRFIDERNGWILSPGGQVLWVTHDGAEPWNYLSLTPPAQVHPSDVDEYQLPLFSDKKHGDIVVTFSAPAAAPDADSAGSEVILFTTSDGGKQWKFDRVLAHLACPHGCDQSSNLEAAVTDSTLVTAQRFNNALTMERAAVTGRGNPTAQRANIGFPGALLSLDLANEQQAWVVTTTSNCAIGLLPCTQLFSTTDAGATWADITPGRGKKEKPQTPTGKPIPLDWKPGGWKRPVTFSASNAVSFHYGFDACQEWSAALMQNLWSGSAFHDVGVYIGDFAPPINLGQKPTSCSQPTASWISNLLYGQNYEQTQDWGIFPIWSGYQAPCGAFATSKTFSFDVGAAKTTGMQMADAAYAAAQSLGLGSGIIYLDLEQYDQTSSACAAAASAYVKGWVMELHHCCPVKTRTESVG